MKALMWSEGDMNRGWPEQLGDKNRGFSSLILWTKHFLPVPEFLLTHNKIYSILPEVFLFQLLSPSEKVAFLCCEIGKMSMQLHEFSWVSFCLPMCLFSMQYALWGKPIPAEKGLKITRDPAFDWQYNFNSEELVQKATWSFVCVSHWNLVLWQ
jgi:hypothetical protein